MINSQIMRSAGNGWRKPTSELLKSEEYARIGETLAIPKTDALVALKRIATSIGLRAQEILLIDVFVAFSKPQDWLEGHRPIVWPSNNYLMEQTGLSLTTLRRHVRRLICLGLIWVKDSSSGRRWGRRDSEGHILEAFGFDLSPLSARFEEFDTHYKQLQNERKFRKSLQHSITICRRVTRSMIETVLEQHPCDVFQDFMSTYERLIETLPTRKGSVSVLMDYLAQFEDFKHDVEREFKLKFTETTDMGETLQNPKIHSECAEKNMLQCNQQNAANDLNMAPSSPHNDTVILSTNQYQYLNKSNVHDNEKPSLIGRVKTDPNLTALERVSNYLALRSRTIDHETITEPRQLKRDENCIDYDASNTKITLQSVLAACPKYAEMVHDMRMPLSGWNDFVRSANVISSMMGISKPVWLDAQNRLSQRVAASVIALIFDKYSESEVTSPGGYLRGIIKKSEAGELHLSRSFYARLHKRNKGLL